MVLFDDNIFMLQLSQTDLGNSYRFNITKPFDQSLNPKNSNLNHRLCRGQGWRNIRAPHHFEN